MILAVGNITVRDIFDAAVAMSSGLTADHDGPITCHPNGWGAVWVNKEDSNTFHYFRSTFPLFKADFETTPLAGSAPHMIAIHARHATVPTKIGLRFAHPLVRTSGAPSKEWHFMHNGFTPTVHKLIGLEDSSFDSDEYFSYLLGSDDGNLSINTLMTKLDLIPDGNSSGNAFLLTQDRAFIIHYVFPGCRYESYFQMHQLVGAGFKIFSSEPIPSLAAMSAWKALKKNSVIELSLEIRHDYR
ncbi:hypothetical protein AAC691_13905 [Nguyenibacter vanlangensis]|uniref:Glutamine amidotransferase type-2 domain-containing protein n=1 Tax=Nguyenibacter vanlangensis TaxID=1216886 RepID=A0ABZ3D125_9PROT